MDAWVLALTRAFQGGHLATLMIPPVLSDTHLKGPCGLEHNSESEAAEVPQPRTVEAKCKANWSAHKQSTEAERATLERAATMALRALERRPPRSQGGSQNRGHRRCCRALQANLFTHISSQFQGTKVRCPLTKRTKIMLLLAGCCVLLPLRIRDHVAEMVGGASNEGCPQISGYWEQGRVLVPFSGPYSQRPLRPS